VHHDFQNNLSLIHVCTFCFDYQEYYSRNDKNFVHRKITVNTPTKMEMPLRPPPKKRAREFAKTEEENGFETSAIIEINDTPAPQVSENLMEKKVVPKNKKKRKKGWGKAQMTISKICLSNLVTDLEHRAESIPEQDRQFKCNSALLF